MVFKLGAAFNRRYMVVILVYMMDGECNGHITDQQADNYLHVEVCMEKQPNYFKAGTFNGLII